MSEQVTGGPAFPVEVLDKQRNGMTLRDYFAAKALPVSMKMLSEDWTNDGEEFAWNSIEVEMVAECAYKIADAMLKARKQ